MFCKIVGGESPCHKVYEDEEFLGFLDITPKSPAHVLVIPKDHYETLLEVPENVVGELFKRVRTLMLRIKTVYNAAGFNVQQNNGRVAGQIVPHVHVHIIPRFVEHLDLKINDFERIARDLMIR